MRRKKNRTERTGEGMKPVVQNVSAFATAARVCFIIYAEWAYLLKYFRNYDRSKGSKLPLISLSTEYLNATSNVVWMFLLKVRFFSCPMRWDLAASFLFMLQVVLVSALLICTTVFLFYPLHDTISVSTLLYKMKGHFRSFPHEPAPLDEYFHIIKQVCLYDRSIYMNCGESSKKNNLFYLLPVIKWKWTRSTKHNTHKLHKISWKCSGTSANYHNTTIL